MQALSRLHPAPLRTVVRPHSVLRSYPHLRTLATVSNPPAYVPLKEAIRRVIPWRLAQLQKLKKTAADHPVTTVTVSQVLGGMRGLPTMLWCSSELDAMEGIRFHGRTIEECQKVLPASNGGVMLPEGMFWYLVTGQVPTEEEVRGFSRVLAERGALPEDTKEMIARFGKDMHPMAQMGMAVASLSQESMFKRAYEEGCSKSEYWEYTLEDVISLLAKLPTIAAAIYRNSYGGPGALETMAAPEIGMDWAGNFARMLGEEVVEGGKEKMGEFAELLRLYLAVHGDHEGGNVSGHVTHLVGSALSDVFLSYGAGLAGLAGPLHGLAAQEVLRYMLELKAHIPENPSDSDIEAYLWKTLHSGRVIPGFGHAVLRAPDPRFAALAAHASAHPAILADPLYTLVMRVSQIAPRVLMEHGKTKNPFPNVDSASGVLFWYYGIREMMWYTVAFGVSRGIGPLGQVVWDRILGLPIERPKSLTMEGLERIVAGKEGRYMY